MDLTKLKGHELIKGYENRDFSCREVTEAYLKNIREKDQEINAYITVTEDLAMEHAKKVDRKYENREELGILAGIPTAIKDNVAVKDVRMTCASKMLENFISPYNSNVSEKILEADGVMLGKVNMDEFAMGAATKTSYFGNTKNPLDTKLVPGGSSGGSAAAVAAEEAAIAIGTDTGGSTRQPASFCGIVGFKPTYGTVSRYGVASMANTFDTVGTMGRDVEDAHLLMKAIAGRDNRDATSVENKSILENIDYEKNYLKDMKIAVPKEYLNMELDSTIMKNYRETIEILKNSGAKIEEVSLKSLEYTIQTYHILVNGEISSNMARLDSLRYGHRTEQNYASYDEMFKKSRAEGFGDEVKKRIMVGTHILSLDLANEYYYKAMKVRTLIKNEYEEIFKNFDLLVSPTAPVLPFEIESDMTPVEMYQADLFTIPANMSGCPSISVPFNSGNFPTGIILTASRFNDIKCIKAGAGLERGVK